MQWQSDTEPGAVVSSTKLEGSVVGDMVVRAIVKAEERATVSAEASTVVKAEDCSVVNAEIVVRARVKYEEPAAVSAGARATVNAGDRSTGNAMMVDRAPVKAEESATVSAEARTAVMDEDRPKMVVLTAAKAEECATANAEVRTTFEAEDCSATNANTVGRVTVKAEERATVSAEARTTAMAEDRAEMVVRAAVKADERATANAEARTTFKAADRSGSNADDMVDRATVRAEEWKFVSAEACITVNAKGYSAINANADSARSGALVHDLDSTRRDKRKDAQALAAILLRELADEKSRRISDELSEIDRKLEKYQKQVSALDRGWAGDGGVAGAGQQWEALVGMNPLERQKEIGRRNRAKRMAYRTIYRRPRHAAGDGNKMTSDWESLTMYAIDARVAGGQDPAEARQMGFRELARTWAEMDPQERARRVAKEQERARRVAKEHRARRMVACSVQRQQRKALARTMAEEGAARASACQARYRDRKRAVVAHARANWSNAAPDGPDSAKACEDDLEATRVHAHAQAPAETDAINAGEREQQTNRTAPVGGIEEVELQTDKTALMGGVGVGKMELQPDRTAVVGGIGAGGVELQMDGTELKGGKGAGELELSTGGAALLNGTAAGKVEQKPTDRTTLTDGLETDEVEQKTGGVALVGGTGVGKVEQQPTDRTASTGGTGACEVDRRSAVVGGTGVDGFPFAESKIVGTLRTQAAPEVAGGVARDEVKRKADPAEARDAEKLETGGQALVMSVLGDGEVGRTAAVAKGADAVGFPPVQSKLEELREKAAVGMAERVARDAVEGKRKADRAQSRHEGNPRRREEKKERKALRAAKRIKKLQHRLDKAKRKGEGSRQPFEIVEDSVRLERDSVAGGKGGMSAEDTVQKGVQADKTARGFEASASSHPGPTG